MFNPKDYYLEKMMINSYVELPLLGVTSFSAIVTTYSGALFTMKFGGQSVTTDFNGSARTLTSDTPQYVVRLSVSGNRSSEDIKSFNSSSGGYTITPDVLYRLFNMESLEFNTDKGKSRLNGDWSIPMPKLKSLKITFHYNSLYPNDTVNITFNKPGLFPVLETLVFYCQSNQLPVTGEAKYLPQTLKVISGGAYANTSGFTGKLSDFPQGIEHVELLYQNGNLIVGYDSRPWTGQIKNLSFRNISLTSAELDQFLNDISNAEFQPNALINFNRNGKTMGVRTSASDAAVATLIAKGVTLTISNNTF